MNAFSMWRGCIGLVAGALFLVTGALAAEPRRQDVGQSFVLAQADAAAVQKLIQNLQSPDEMVRLRAAKELGKLGPAAGAAIPALQKAVNDADEDVRRVAANSLKAVQAGSGGGNEKVARLIRDLQNPDEVTRLRAAKELGKLGPVARDAISALQKALNDSDEDVRRVAQHSLRLVQAGPAPSDNAVQQLIQKLSSPDEVVRMQGAKGLAKLGPAARAAIPALQKLLQDPDEDVRRVAANAIDRIQGAGGPVSGPIASVAGTTWRGTESLAGFGSLTFEFAADGKAIMVDAKTRIAGKWAQAGNQLTVTFGNCVYQGEIRDRTFAGSARYTTGEAVWNFSLTRENGAPPAPTPTPPPPPTSSIVGTTWSGNESLGGFGALTFRFEPNGNAVMIDAKSTVRGTWAQNGNQVTITFQNCVYTGTIQGQVLAGNARMENQTWAFSVTRNANPNTASERGQAPGVARGDKPYPEHKFPPCLMAAPPRR